MPKMTHPNSKKTIEVREDQVAMYVSQGWQAEKATPKTVLAGEPGPELVTPAPSGHVARKKK